jgi:hypothetical protein
MLESYNSYCFYVFILGEEDTILQYNSKLLKKKKKKKKKRKKKEDY